MAVYAVTWNINNAGPHYLERRQAFLKHLERYPNIWDSGLETVRWVQSTNGAQHVISNDLQTKLDRDDRLFVVRVHAGDYDGWIDSDVGSWIAARL